MAAEARLAPACLMQPFKRTKIHILSFKLKKKKKPGVLHPVHAGDGLHIERYRLHKRTFVVARCVLWRSFYLVYNFQTPLSWGRNWTLHCAATPAHLSSISCTDLQLTPNQQVPSVWQPFWVFSFRNCWQWSWFQALVGLRLGDQMQKSFNLLFFFKSKKEDKPGFRLNYI